MRNRTIPILLWRCRLAGTCSGAAASGKKRYKRPYRKLLHRVTSLCSSERSTKILQLELLVNESRLTSGDRRACGDGPSHGSGQPGRESNADGELAPSLSSLVIEGKFDQRARAHLDEFYAWLLASPVVVRDLSAHNIVYGFDHIMALSSS